jgi:DNA invertase Pin-like site-specific DNA recombinase
VQTGYSYIRFSHEEQLTGDSERRQSEAIEAYAKEHGMVLDYSLKPDRAVSAFRGKHRKKGHLAAFVRKVESGEVKPGSALVIESLDRLSREEPEEALTFLLDLVRRGLEIHCILDREVYRRGEMDEMRLFKAILTYSRSSQESKRKSERCSEIAAQNRERARNGVCISARVPGWLIAVKGGTIEPHPEHAETVHRVFQLASEGLGATRICDLLNKERVPAFNRKKRWYPMYISEVLRSRAAIGEFQPGTHPRGGVWSPAGPPIKDYYPRIIDDELWYRVQEIRAGNFARGKVQVGKYHGSGKASWRNLFTGLVVDEAGISMRLKRVAERAYFISSDREKFKTHQMGYEVFEAVMLELLGDIDYAALTKEATPIEESQRQQLNDTLSTIVDLERKRKRYLRIIEGEEEPDEEIIQKYRSAGIDLKKLQAKKESLERAINGSAAPKLTKIPIIEVNQTRKEYNLRLKDEIRKRVAQIQLSFSAEVLSVPDPNRKTAGVRPGKGQIVAKITFTNGVVKWAFIDGLNATLLSYK